MSEKPLTPWVVAERTGKILAAHCDCVAGLGETCSHVASLLFAIESGVRIRDSMTVTQKKAYWVMPTGVKEVQFAPVKEIDFLGKKGSVAVLESLDFGPSPLKSIPTSTQVAPSSTVASSVPSVVSPVNSLSSQTSPSTSTNSQSHLSGTPVPAVTSIPRASKSPTLVREKTPSHDETMTFFSSLAACSSKPAILSLIDPYSSRYIPQTLDSGLPTCLSELYKPEYAELNYGELLTVAKNYSVSITEEQALLVESKTRLQSNSRLWLRMRTGRVTASRFKAVCRTNLAQPSLSLVMALCHPEIAKFKSIATSWGCEHEKTAISKYLSISLRKHHNFEVKECGFFINTSKPYIGASPDSLVTCTCCDDGICEIKVRKTNFIVHLLFPPVILVSVLSQA